MFSVAAANKVTSQLACNSVSFTRQASFCSHWDLGKCWFWTPDLPYVWRSLNQREPESVRWPFSRFLTSSIVSLTVFSVFSAARTSVSHDSERLSPSLDVGFTALLRALAHSFGPLHWAPSGQEAGFTLFRPTWGLEVQKPFRKAVSELWTASNPRRLTPCGLRLFGPSTDTETVWLFSKN